MKITVSTIDVPAISEPARLCRVAAGPAYACRVAAGPAYACRVAAVSHSWVSDSAQVTRP